MIGTNNTVRQRIAIICILLFAGCASAPDVPRIRIWHQKIGPERLFFERVIDEYNRSVSR